MRGQILIENLLDECLDVYLRGGVKPFREAPFAAKIRLAYAVGLLNDEERELFNTLREIRNRLAHRLDAYATKADEKLVTTLLMRLIPDLDKGKDDSEGYAAYQVLILVLFCVMMVRHEDVGGQTLSLVAKPKGKEYSERLYRQMWLPLLAGVDPKKATGLEVIALAVFAALSLFASKVKADEAKKKKGPSSDEESEAPEAGT